MGVGFFGGETTFGNDSLIGCSTSSSFVFTGRSLRCAKQSSQKEGKALTAPPRTTRATSYVSHKTFPTFLHLSQRNLRHYNSFAGPLSSWGSYSLTIGAGSSPRSLRADILSSGVSFASLNVFLLTQSKFAPPPLVAAFFCFGLPERVCCDNGTIVFWTFYRFSPARCRPVFQWCRKL